MKSVAVIDTDVLSFFFRKDTRADNYIEILDSIDILTISFQTIAELEYWALKHGWGVRRRAELQTFLEPYPVIHSTADVCSLWSLVRHERTRQGLPISPQDAWIAATSLALRCPLITNNANDFKGLLALELLTASR